MGLFWKAPIHKTVALLDQSGKRELFWYGVTIGQVGFGLLASEKRQPTKRASDDLESPAKNQPYTAEVKSPAKKRKVTSRA